MLPSHRPLVIAEQFGTLATLFQNRIDLGLGRAAGSHMATAKALRRHLVSEDSFSQDVCELADYLWNREDQALVRTIPGNGTKVPIWILGSNLHGASLAVQFVLPYASTSHFAPAVLKKTLSTYRNTFMPSKWFATPYVIIGASVFAADTDEEVTYLRSSQVQAFASLISGHPRKLPAPMEDLSSVVHPQIQDYVTQALSCSANGSLSSTRKQLQKLIDKYQPDEMIISNMIYNHSARINSFCIALEALTDLCGNQFAA